jgi:hypothetical protein
VKVRALLPQLSLNHFSFVFLVGAFFVFVPAAIIHNTRGSVVLGDTNSSSRRTTLNVTLSPSRLSRQVLQNTMHRFTNNYSIP